MAWLDDRKLAERSWEHHESAIRLHLLPIFGERPLSSITTASVRAWRTTCLKRTGEPTVVQAYQVLRAVLNTAVDDELLRRNPWSSGSTPTCRRVAQGGAADVAARAWHGA